jgi:hypothetical protein
MAPPAVSDRPLFTPGQLAFAVNGRLAYPAMTPTDKRALMREIVAKVGREKAIELVTESYNTELVTTWLSRMEVDKPKMMAKPKPRDHLAEALTRVASVCDLAS